MKRKNFLKHLIYSLLAFSCIFISSCEDDPDYLGTWIATESVLESGITMEIKDIMTFTENKLSNIGQLKNPNTNKWVNVSGIKADITVNKDIIKYSITEIGMTTYDIVTGNPTGTIVYFNESDKEFVDLLSFFGLTISFANKYSVSGNTLTLKADDNNDGDYDDDFETLVYTKQ